MSDPEMARWVALINRLHEASSDCVAQAWRLSASKRLHEDIVKAAEELADKSDTLLWLARNRRHVE